FRDNSLQLRALAPYEREGEQRQTEAAAATGGAAPAVRDRAGIAAAGARAGVRARVGARATTAARVADVVLADRHYLAAVRAAAGRRLERAVGAAPRLGLVGGAVPHRPGVVARAAAAERLHVLAPLPVLARVAMVVGAAVARAGLAVVELRHARRRVLAHHVA